ncbi:50S ribosomal protein L25 [Candidatus Gottesmanbacteria bacterium]|nr:50S ribosomal protein L25 [Candidatus Gottesmanbacteria bacterium]
MKKHSLTATKRDLLGRKVKKLRAAGQIPATVYGKKVKSVSVAVAADAFGKTYGEAGETGLVELSLNGSVRPVLVHHVQKHPVTGAVLHVEFHQVDLKQKVHANVPLVLVGDSPAVAEKKGVLLTILDEIEVEALPTDLVDKIEVDVSMLSEVNQEVKVKDLKVPSGLTVLSDAELTVVKVGSLISREAEAEAAAEAAKVAEAAAAAAAAPAAEGQAPADQPVQAGKKEEAKEEKKGE